MVISYEYCHSWHEDTPPTPIHPITPGFFFIAPQAQRAMRDKEAQLNNSRRQLQLHRIDVDMERICYYVEQVSARLSARHC